MTTQLDAQTPRRTQMRRIRARTTRAQAAAFGMSTSAAVLPCRELGAQWHACEREVVALLGRRLNIEAVQEAAALTSRCKECPILNSCADWARADRYTGVAGGQVVHQGQWVDAT